MRAEAWSRFGALRGVVAACHDAARGRVERNSLEVVKVADAVLTPLLVLGGNRKLVEERIAEAYEAFMACFAAELDVRAQSR